MSGLIGACAQRPGSGAEVWSHISLPPRAPLAKGDNRLWAAWVRAEREVSTALVRRGHVPGHRRKRKTTQKSMKLIKTKGKQKETTMQRKADCGEKEDRGGKGGDQKRGATDTAR